MSHGSYAGDLEAWVGRGTQRGLGKTLETMRHGWNMGDRKAWDGRGRLGGTGRTWASTEG